MINILSNYHKIFIMEMRKIYLPKNLTVDISVKYNSDNIEVSFLWNKANKYLPYDEEKRDRMDGCTLEKNNLVIKLLKYLLLVKDNKKNAILLIEKYLNLSDNDLSKHIIVTPIMLYREYLQETLSILKRTKDFHIGLIEAIELLWI